MKWVRRGWASHSTHFVPGSGGCVSLSVLSLCIPWWTLAYQALLSMEFSRQECWNGLPFPSPGDLSDPGIKPGYPALQVNSSLSLKVKLSNFRLFATPCTIQFMEFSRPEHWSGYHFPSSGDLPNPGIEPGSPVLQADSLPTEFTISSWW